MKLNLQPLKQVKPVHILLVGNNPGDMDNVLEKLSQVRVQKIITEIAFSVKTITDRLLQFHPDFILIDDNIGRSSLQEAVRTLLSNRKTKDIPITVLKNSNYSEALGATSILDYLLKQTLSAESLLNTVQNLSKHRKTQFYLSQAYSKRKDLLREIDLKK